MKGGSISWDYPDFQESAWLFIFFRLRRLRDTFDEKINSMPLHSFTDQTCKLCIREPGGVSEFVFCFSFQVQQLDC